MGSRQNIAIPFGMEKLEWRGYQLVKKNVDRITRVDRIHERVRHTHTHRHTPHDGIGRAYRIAGQKSSDFHEMLYTAAYFELDERQK